MNKMTLFGGVALALFGFSAPASAVTVTLVGAFPTLIFQAKGLLLITLSPALMVPLAMSTTNLLEVQPLNLASGLVPCREFLPHRMIPDLPNTITSRRAEPARLGGSPGTVTLSTIDHSTFTALDILWGTVDNTALRNLVVANMPVDRFRATRLLSRLALLPMEHIMCFCISCSTTRSIR